MARSIEPDLSTVTAFLDRGSRFEGTLTFQGTVRIDGVFRGDVVNGNNLVLGEQAEVEGSINVEDVLISGQFTGTITAGKKVTLHPSAVVNATITAPVLTINEGAVFNGSIQMTAQEQPAHKHHDKRKHPDSGTASGVTPSTAN